jgi:hypothetical protein
MPSMQGQSFQAKEHDELSYGMRQVNQTGNANEPRGRIAQKTPQRASCLIFQVSEEARMKH